MARLELFTNAQALFMNTTQGVHTGGTRFGLQHGYNTVLGARFAKNPLVLDIPIYITGMSYGACSGDGGAIPEEREW